MDTVKERGVGKAPIEFSSVGNECIMKPLTLRLPSMNKITAHPIHCAFSPLKKRKKKGKKKKKKKGKKKKKEEPRDGNTVGRQTWDVEVVVELGSGEPGGGEKG